ncbi:MAG: [NiFe]-hydrogenase assembly chaperone HybE [Methylococcaceae bacterium]
MHWQNSIQLSHALEDCFNTIQLQRMTGIPIINPQLKVQAVDFQAYQQGWIGVLITPWFMNIIYLSDELLTVGEKISHQFPAGQFEFTIAYEINLGFYQNCSLYSPMFEFTEQDTAIKTAQSALQALLKLPEKLSISRRDLLRGKFTKG